MKIDLPEVDWQSHNWTIPGQLKKIFEEAGEVAEAVALADPVNTIREALGATLISMVQEEWGLPLEKFIQEHNNKLQCKGYLKE